jgi:riboflavin synthase
MFTGIIESKSEVLFVKKVGEILTLAILRPSEWQLTVGQSIAVNGVCLTVVSFTDTEFVVEIVPETINKTTFSSDYKSDVNLERAMPANGRFEGHVVQGHVDTVGKISQINRLGETALFDIIFDPQFDELVVEKGSITIDGVSLTVVKVVPGGLSVALIPYTLNLTTLGEKREADEVNLEFDILGKYIVKNKLS